MQTRLRKLLGVRPGGVKQEKKAKALKLVPPMPTKEKLETKMRKISYSVAAAAVISEIPDSKPISPSSKAESFFSSSLRGTSPKDSVVSPSGNQQSEPSTIGQQASLRSRSPLLKRKAREFEDEVDASHCAKKPSS